MASVGRQSGQLGSIPRAAAFVCDRGDSVPGKSFPSSEGNSQRETHKENESRLEITSDASKQKERRFVLQMPVLLFS